MSTTFHYVDENATGADNGTSWTDAYESLETCLAGGVDDQDLVRIEYRHSKDYGAATTLSIPKSLRIISLDSANNTYRRGATERTSVGDFKILMTTAGKQLYCEGLDFETFGGGGSITIGSETVPSIHMTFTLCRFEPDDDGGLIIAAYQGQLTGEFNRCVIQGEGVLDQGIIIDSGRYRFQNCTWESVKTGASVFKTGENGIYDLTVENSNLDEFATLIDNTAGFAGKALFRRCRIQTNVVVATEPLSYPDQIWTEYCDDLALTKTPLGISGWGQTYPATMAGGTMGFDTATFRTTDGGSDGENQYSIRLAGNAYADYARPLTVPQRLALWHDASGSKSLTIWLCSTKADLDDSQIWAEVGWGDNEAYATGNFLSTYGGYGLGEEADTSTYLKSDTSDWTTSETVTKYKLVIPGLVTQEPCAVDVQLKAAAGAVDIWVCPNVDLADE